MNEYEVNVTGPEAEEFVRTHEKEGAGIFEAVQLHVAKALAKWQQEGKDHWPADTRVVGPLELKIIMGPLEGQTVQAYQFSIYAAPEGDPDKFEVFHLGLQIDGDEIVGVVEAATPQDYN